MIYCRSEGNHKRKRSITQEEITFSLDPLIFFFFFRVNSFTCRILKLFQDSNFFSEHTLWTLLMVKSLYVRRGKFMVLTLQEQKSNHCTVANSQLRCCCEKDFFRDSIKFSVGEEKNTN